MPASMPSYANARRVLPRGLLRHVQRHFHGGLLWVPSPTRRRAKTRGDVERNRRMRAAKHRGVPVRKLAARYRLSEERVRQILRRPKPDT